MSINIGMVTFDTTDAVALANWWAKVLDGKATDGSGGWFVMVESEGNPNLGFQKIEDPTPGKNRLHLDMSGSDYAKAVDRLQSLGAELVAEHKEEFGTWTTFADPDGNQFCVANMASF